MNIFKRLSADVEPGAIQSTIDSLEAKKGSIVRWFLRFFVAFNLVLWSVVVSIAFLMRVHSL